MPVANVAGAAEFTVYGSGPNANDWSLVFHIGRRGASTTAFTEIDVAGILADVGAWAGSDLADVLTTNYEVVGARGKDISTNPNQAAQDILVNAPGTITGESCPPQCALVITKRTPFAGRKFRGRFYHPCIPEGEQNAGVVTTTFAADVLAAYEALKTALDQPDPDGWVLSVVSRVSPGTKVGVTELTINPRVDTQRRRAGRT